MQDSGFLVISHIFSSIALDRNNLSTLNQAFIKSIWMPTAVVLVKNVLLLVLTGKVLEFGFPK